MAEVNRTGDVCSGAVIQLQCEIGLHANTIVVGICTPPHPRPQHIHVTHLIGSNDLRAVCIAGPAWAASNTVLHGATTSGRRVVTGAAIGAAGAKGVGADVSFVAVGGVEHGRVRTEGGRGIERHIKQYKTALPLTEGSKESHITRQCTVILYLLYSVRRVTLIITADQLIGVVHRCAVDREP